MNRVKIIACDFDGTLFTDAYPNIGDPIYENINALKAEQAAGSKVILWTCRTGVELQEAIYACLEKDILFDAINQNLDHIIKEFRGDKRKIFAHEYWDDRAVYKSSKGLGDFSDGYHTFNELYDHRAVLFSVICNSMADKAWKSKLHHDGTMYEGMFIVGINTPEGQATYHYDIAPYWDIFKVPELPKAPEWDGHTPAEAIKRIGGLV